MAVNEIPRDHAGHDELLVVAYASDDLVGGDAERAAVLVASCSECGRIAADVRALRTNVAGLPAPRRTRDFRLTEEDAARLRPRGWRGLVAILAGPRLSLAAPVGTAIATLGIVGLLVAVAPSSFMAGAASAPALSASGGATVQSAAGGQSGESAAGALTSGTADTGVAAVPVPSTAASAAASAGAVEPYAAASTAPDLTATPPPLAAAPNPVSASGSAATGPVAASPAASAPAQAKSAAGPASPAEPLPSSEARTSMVPSTPGAPSAGVPPLAIASGILVLVGLALVVGRLGARRLSA